MPIREPVRHSSGVIYSGGSVPTETPQALPQVEHLNSVAGDLRLRATAILDSLRDMRTSAFGPQPEAVGGDKPPKLTGAVNILSDQLQDVSDTLTACESVLREVRRII